MIRHAYKYNIFAGISLLRLVLVSVLLLCGANLTATSETETAPPDSTKTLFNPVPYDEAPQALSPIMPKYPSKCLKANIQGTVLLEVGVSKTGSIESITVKKSVDKGIGGLDAAAIEAVKKVKFKPGKVDGKAVDSLVIIPVQFKLN